MVSCKRLLAVLCFIFFPSTVRAEGFANFFSPLTLEKFVTDYFGQSIVRVNAQDSKDGAQERISAFDYDDLLNTVKSNSLKPLENVKFVFHDTEVFVDGEFNQDDPSSSIVTKETMEAHFEAGHTMMIKQANIYSHKLQKLACHIHGSLGHNAGVNVYYSPPNTTGFKLHHDGHDLLIVQSIGSKCWKVCEQPFKDQLPIDAKHYTNDPYHNPGELKCQHIGLRQGDLLYLPRGTLHAPHTMGCKGFPGVGRVSSMHLSIGIDVLQSRWLNVLQQTLQMYTEKGERYTMSCADNNQQSLMDDFGICDLRRRSYPPLVPFLFARNQSWAWVNILEIALIMGVSSDTPVARNLREHFPIHHFGLEPGTEEMEKDAEVFQNLQFQYNILVHLVSSACSNLLRGFVTKVLTKRNVSSGEATSRDEYVAEQCKLAVLENLGEDTFVPALVLLIRRSRAGYAQKCSRQSQEMNGHGIGTDPALPPQTSAPPSFMSSQQQQFEDPQKLPDYNKLRKLGVDKRAMDAIRDIFGDL
eukprot:Stramenopile-MAST_4_protein_1758